MNTNFWKNCTTDGNPPVIGEKYIIKHVRKGTFKGIVLSVTDTWADVQITEGEANAILDYNVCEKDDMVAIRSSLCTMEKIL